MIVEYFHEVLFFFIIYLSPIFSRNVSQTTLNMFSSFISPFHLPFLRKYNVTSSPEFSRCQFQPCFLWSEGYFKVFSVCLVPLRGGSLYPNSGAMTGISRVYGTGCHFTNKKQIDPSYIYYHIVKYLLSVKMLLLLEFWKSWCCQPYTLNCMVLCWKWRSEVSCCCWHLCQYYRYGVSQ